MGRVLFQQLLSTFLVLIIFGGRYLDHFIRNFYQNHFLVDEGEGYVWFRPFLEYYFNGIHGIRKDNQNNIFQRDSRIDDSEPQAQYAMDMRLLWKIQQSMKYLKNIAEQKEQDGPSLEPSSYLNESLRYLGPFYPWTLEPLDLGTLGPLPSSNTSSYFPLHPLTSSYLLLLLSSFGTVWLWGGEL